MAYIFMDESGDLGFNFSKKRTSKFFIVTFLFVENKRHVEKIIKQAHATLKRKYKIKNAVLHAAKEEHPVIKRVCKKIVEKKFKIMVISLDKSKVYTNLREEKHVLYNYIVNILLNRIINKRLITDDKITLIASKRETNKFLNKNFHDYLCKQLKRKHCIELDIKIKTPAEEKSLQAVDIVSWSVFRKYEYRDDTFYNLIRSSVLEENALY